MRFSKILIVLVIALLPVVVSWTTIGSEAVASTVFGGLSIGIMVWYFSPLFGHPLDLVSAVLLSGWFSSLGYFAVVIKQTFSVGLVVDVVLFGGRICHLVYSFYTHVPKVVTIHIHRSPVVPLVKSFGILSPFDTDAFGLAVERNRYLTNKFQEMIRLRGAKSPDMRLYPHSVPPIATDGHFRKVDVTSPVRSRFGRLSNVTRHFVVCTEFVNTLLVRAQGIAQSSDWFYEQVNKISPVNVPSELDRQLRIQSAAAAFFEAQHEKELYQRLVSTSDPPVDWSVVIRLAVQSCLKVVSFCSLGYFSIVARFLGAIAAVAPASFFRLALE